MTFGLIPKILCTVYMIMAVRKLFAMVYAIVCELAYIKHIIAMIGISIYYAVRRYLLAYGGQQG